MQREPVAGPSEVGHGRPAIVNSPGIVGVFVALAVMYGYQIWTVSIFYDESITLLTASGHAVPDWSLGMRLFEPSTDLTRILDSLIEFDVHPPLYFWTVALWRSAFGGSLEAARSLSALFVLATVFLLYRIAIMLDVRRPIVVPVVFALSGAAFQYAFTARAYAMATFLIVLTLYLAQRKSMWAGAAAAAAVATHYFAALLVAPLLLWYCAHYWKIERRWSWFVAISFVVMCSPLLVLAARHFHARPHQFAGSMHWRAESVALLKAAIASAFPKSSWFFVRALTMIAGTCLIAIGGFIAIKRKSIAVPFTFCAYLIGFFALTWASHKTIVSMPGPYYLGLCAPLIALLVGDAVGAMPLRVEWVLAGLLAAGVITGVPLISSEFRSIVANVRAECDTCTIVVGAGSGRGIPGSVLYETGGRNLLVLTDARSVESLTDRPAANHPIYFIPSSEQDTAQAETEFADRFAATPRDGYVKLDIRNGTQ